MKDESTVSQEIQIQSMYHHCTLMRNNSGVSVNPAGQLVRFGLGNTSKKRTDEIKSSDLIGITKIVITQEMVGQIIGVFTAIEVKKEDWNPGKKLDAREKAQNRFISWIVSQGGFAGFCNSVENLKNIFIR